VRCVVGHIVFNIDLDCLAVIELVRSNSPRSLVPPSKFERVVESSITLVRCVNAESAELRSHSIVMRKQVMAISERFA